MINDAPKAAAPVTEVDKAYEFVSKIIASCNQPFHVQCGNTLLSLFKEKFYNRHGGKVAYERLQEELLNRLPTFTF